MTLILKSSESAHGFAERALTFLLAHEAEHCLLIGIVAVEIAGDRQWDGPLTFATVERNGSPIAAAVQTPPFRSVISRVDDLEVVPLLVDHLALLT